MAVYTVHEPPLGATEALPDPERFAFVRDGFYFWAFALTPLWMLRRRLWLVLLIYLVVAVGANAAMRFAGFGVGSIAFVQFLIALLVGFEASTLRRFTLARRGYRNVGVVAGDTAEAAERRFFDAWARAGGAASEPPASVPASPPVPGLFHGHGIIGLFPEPGAHR
jgi:hypothetical protein